MTNNNTYKQTPIGLIPKDWEVKKLGEVGKVITGNTPSRSDMSLWNGDYCWATSKDFKSKYITNTIEKISLKGCKVARLLPAGSILITCIASIGNNAIASVALATNQQINSIIVFDNYYNEWLYYQLAFFKQELELLAGKTAVPIINKSEFEKVKIPIPPLPEQEKIAKILSTWDEAIDKCKGIIENLKQRKKGLAQEILLGKIRFSETQNSPLMKNKGYVIPKDWKVAPISKLVKQVKKSVTPEPDTLYSQIGIRSHAKGIFYKEAVTGLSLGNKSVFEIEPNCFIVNIVFAWEHAIAKTTINEVGMIASHRFPMYKPLENELDLDYMLHFFKSKKGKELLGIASPGGAGRNKTLGQSEFLKLSIPVPPLAEQKRIAEFLDKIDTEIIVHQQKLAHLQNQKKGLMQQLLTGKVRVKVNH